MTRKLFCLFIAAVVALGAAGCGKSAKEKIMEKAIEQSMAKEGGQADVDLNDGKISMTNAEGTKVEWAGDGQSVEIPKEFPKDVYVYPRARAIGSMVDREGITLTMDTPDRPEKVTADYKEKMSKEGWKEESAIAAQGMAQLVWSREERTVMVNIGKADKITQIVTVVQGKEKKSPAATPTPEAEKQGEEKAEKKE